MSDKSTLGLILESVNEIKQILESGPVGEKDGLVSLAFSPALSWIDESEFTALFPVYSQDIADEEYTKSIALKVEYDSLEEYDNYTITVTPTSKWYVKDFNGDEGSNTGEIGEAFSITDQVVDNAISFDFAVIDPDDENVYIEYVMDISEDK